MLIWSVNVYYSASALIANQLGTHGKPAEFPGHNLSPNPLEPLCQSHCPVLSMHGHV